LLAGVPPMMKVLQPPPLNKQSRRKEVTILSILVPMVSRLRRTQRAGILLLRKSLMSKKKERTRSLAQGSKKLLENPLLRRVRTRPQRLEM